VPNALRRAEATCLLRCLSSGGRTVAARTARTDQGAAIDEAAGPSVVQDSGRFRDHQAWSRRGAARPGADGAACDAVAGGARHQYRPADADVLRRRAGGQRLGSDPRAGPSAGPARDPDRAPRDARRRNRLRFRHRSPGRERNRVLRHL